MFSPSSPVRNGLSASTHALQQHRQTSADNQSSSSIVVGVYLIIFGLCIALLGMPIQPPPIGFSNPLQSSKSPLKSRATPLSSSPSSVAESVSQTPLTDGVLALTRTVYIFIGCLILGDKVLSQIAGGIVGIIGIAYVALEFVPSIEPPANMREAEAAGWGAEQV